MLSPPKAKDTFFRFYYYFNKYQIYFFLYKKSIDSDFQSNRFSDFKSWNILFFPNFSN